MVCILAIGRLDNSIINQSINWSGGGSISRGGGAKGATLCITAMGSALKFPCYVIVSAGGGSEQPKTLGYATAINQSINQSIKV